MCVSAAVVAGVSLAATAVSTVMAIDNANYQHSMMLLQQEEQLKQLTGQRIDAEQAGLQAQLDRIAEFEERRSANLAAMAANTGFGSNMGYFQGTREAEEKALAYDLSNIRLQVLGEKGRIGNQERQLGYGRIISNSNRKSAIAGSLFNAIGQAAQTANYYDTFKGGSVVSGGAGNTNARAGDPSAGWR